MNVWVMNNVAKVYVKKRYLNDVLDFCKKRKLKRSIVVVKRKLSTNYCVIIYGVRQYALDLMVLAFDK